MRALIALGALVGLALWSGLAWLAHGLVDQAGAFATRHADKVTSHPETVEWLSWAAGLSGDLGGWVVLGVWALGSIAIVGAAIAAAVLGKGGVGKFGRMRLARVFD